MQSPVKERVQQLRQEIADTTEANGKFVKMHYKHGGAVAEHERRLQRLKEIMDELRALTDWKET